MLFNSIEFSIFLPIVFLLYWYVAKNNTKYQNLILLVSSYIFYGCWDWRFLLLLIFSTLLDYFSAIKIAEASNQSQKKFWFWLSIGINLGFLSVFKYYNFFVTSLVDSMAHFGLHPNVALLEVILPVGISFYTFHGLSYVIDVYYERIIPQRNFIFYSVFVCFFPLLVAGPIERATHLLPQIIRKREFDYAKAIDGLRQILWGLFKKIVIADNCATYSNRIFDTYQIESGSTLFIGAVFFAFQIYGDFSGYSDIALGTARLFGIELLQNFSFPYFSRDIAEFWRRWHISLTTWFRDYIYIPLGGSRVSKWKVLRNTFVIFLVSGFWHGANWTYIAWGAYHALLFLPLIIFKINRKNIDTVSQGKVLPDIIDLFQILTTFSLVVIGWVFFRSATIHDAFGYLSRMFSAPYFTLPHITKKTLLYLSVFIVVEWLNRDRKFGLEISYLKNSFLRKLIYAVIVFLIVIFMGKNETFIYFQF